MQLVIRGVTRGMGGIGTTWRKTSVEFIPWCRRRKKKPSEPGEGMHYASPDVSQEAQSPRKRKASSAAVAAFADVEAWIYGHGTPSELQGELELKERLRRLGLELGAVRMEHSSYRGLWGAVLKELFPTRWQSRQHVAAHVGASNKVLRTWREKVITLRRPEPSAEASSAITNGTLPGRGAEATEHLLPAAAAANAASAASGQHAAWAVPPGSAAAPAAVWLPWAAPVLARAEPGVVMVADGGARPHLGCGGGGHASSGGRVPEARQQASPIPAA